MLFTDWSITPLFPVKVETIEYELQNGINNLTFHQSRLFFLTVNLSYEQKMLNENSLDCLK